MPEPATFDIWCSIVAYNTPVAEIEALAAVLAEVDAAIALTVIDNSGTLPAITAPPRLAFEQVSPGRNLGYGRAHNIAIERSRGRCRYHLVMNSDITFDPESLVKLLAFMDATPDAGLAMPMVRYPDGQIQHLCRLLPDPAVLIGRRFLSRMAWAKRLNDRYELKGWSYDSVRSFPFLSGCFMFMRRSVLDEVQGFDPRFFLYAEDLDLSRRLHACSQTLFYPEASITHEYRSLKRRSFRQWMYAIRSLTQYFNKWGWLIDRERDRINALTLAQFAD